VTSKEYSALQAAIDRIEKGVNAALAILDRLEGDKR